MGDLQIIPKFISDDDLEKIQGKPYDLYKWQCAFPDCTNGAKLRLYHEYPGIQYQVFHQEITADQLFVWQRKLPRWIVKWWHYYICSRHRKKHDKLEYAELRKLHEQDNSTKFILIKKNHTDETHPGKNSGHRLIEPIETPLPKNRNRWQY